MMTTKELQFIKQLLEALQRKCKTDALYNWTCDGLRIVNREINLDVAVSEIQEEALMDSREQIDD